MTVIQFWRQRAATYTSEQNPEAARVCESRADRLERKRLGQ